MPLRARESIPFVNDLFKLVLLLVCYHVVVSLEKSIWKAYMECIYIYIYMYMYIKHIFMYINDRLLLIGTNTIHGWLDPVVEIL